MTRLAPQRKVKVGRQSKMKMHRMQLVMILKLAAKPAPATGRVSE
jgi:hypothetical protein